MGKLTLMQDNTPLREMLGKLIRDVSHFNLLFYNTNTKGADGYLTLPDSIGNDIVPAASLKDAEKLKLNGYANGAAIGVSSLVRLENGTFGHMKQLDIDETPAHPQAFMKSLENIIGTLLDPNLSCPGAEGYLVNSGSDIHYYGSELMSTREWHSWLDRAERLKSVDKKWIELSRKREYSALRINATKEKPAVPEVFCRFSYK